MNNRDAAVLAFKLLGLWLMANAAIGVAAIPSYWDPRFDEVRAMTVLATLLPVLVAVGIGVPVWFSAEWFANRIFPAEGRAQSPLDRLRIEPLLALALSVLGVCLIAEALPALVNGAALFSQSRLGGSTLLGPDMDRQALIWSAAAKANFAAAIARLAIGVGLVAGPARLSAALARLRKELKGGLSDDPAAGADHAAAEQRDAADEVRDGERPCGPRS